MSEPEQLSLESAVPDGSWLEDKSVQSLKRGPLSRWGDVKMGCRMLDDIIPRDFYALIDAGCVRAYKIKPHSRTSKWRVDLASVWEFKQAQMRPVGR